jgi:hypothetical protein
MGARAEVAEIASESSEWEARDSFPPGPQLAICLAGEQRLADRDDAELIEIMAAAHRQAAWAQARELAAIAALADRRDAEDDGDENPHILSAGEALIDEVAAALTVTGNTAAMFVRTATRLTRSLPATFAALATGHIDMAKARVICDITEGLPDAVTAILETAVLERAPRQTTGQLRHRAKKLARRLAPDAFEEQADQAFSKRRVELWENTTGTAGLALLDINAEDAHAVHNRLTAAARAIRADSRTDETGADPRNLDQIRADLATRLLRGQSLPEAATALLQRSTEQPASPPREPQIATVSPPAPSRPASPAPDGHTPAALRSVPPGGIVYDGVSPQHPDLSAPATIAPVTGRPSQTNVAAPTSDGHQRDEIQRGRREHVAIAALADDIDRRLAWEQGAARAAGQLGRLRTRITGTVRDMHRALEPIRETHCPTDEEGHHGHPGYRPPASLRRKIQERHPVCVFPSCNRLAEHCDLDHTVPYHAHGPTCGCNLAPLCRRHHRLKASPGWRLFQPWPGLLIWITPSGTWHIVQPE